MTTRMISAALNISVVKLKVIKNKKADWCHLL